MTIWTTIASWLVGAAVMAFSAALSVSPPADMISAKLGPADTSFEAPRAVVLRGYGGDAMEPFVTRDGRWLLFNTRNGPRDQTDLMVARHDADGGYSFIGPMTGANSAMLDGVASVDRRGNLFLVSNRDYDSSGNTLWTGKFADGKASAVRPLASDFTPRKLLRLNIDLEVSGDGEALYVAENRWDLLRGRPATSTLAVAARVGVRFVRRPDSDAMMRAVNGAALAYAPATSDDQLTLYFTRWDAGASGAEPAIFVSRRTARTAAWSPPRRLTAASGFVEGPTVLPGGCTIMYHARVGEAYRLFTVKRRGC